MEILNDLWPCSLGSLWSEVKVQPCLDVTMLSDVTAVGYFRFSVTHYIFSIFSIYQQRVIEHLWQRYVTGAGYFTVYQLTLLSSITQVHWNCKLTVNIINYPKHLSLIHSFSLSLSLSEKSFHVSIYRTTGTLIPVYWWRCISQTTYSKSPSLENMKNLYHHAAN